MPSALGVAGEIAGSATALAGLILVFLGAIASSFEAYSKQEQTTVKAVYQRRAWFAFVGFALSLSASVSALAAKWLSQACLAFVALVLLAIAFLWVTLAALSAVKEIK